MINILMIMALSLLQTSADNDSKKKVLFFGDSITQMGVQQNGYISLIRDMLKNKGMDADIELIGSGIGGNKVYDLFYRMEKDVLSYEPDVVVIWVGVNDVWHKSSYGTGTDIDKFESMYGGIIQRLQSKGITVYCCTPACIGEKTDHSNAQDGDLNEYSKVIRKVANSEKAGLIDFRKSFLEYNLSHNPDNLAKGILTTDGVHLNEKGNMFVAEMIWGKLFTK